MHKVLQAMADPTRFEILRMVHLEELAAGEIAKKFGNISRPAVSQHIKILRDEELVVERREGTRILYRLNPEGFSEIKPILEQLWDPRLIRLRDAALRWRKP